MPDQPAAANGDFRTELQRFMADTGMSRWQLGKGALNDSRFVYDVLGGDRSPNLRTVEKVRCWMQAYRDQHRTEGDTPCQQT